MQQRDEYEYVYQARSIEPVGNVAARFGVTVNQLIKINARLKGKLFVSYGEEIIIPQSRGLMASLSAWERTALLKRRIPSEPAAQQPETRQTAATYTTDAGVVLSTRVADVVRRIDEEYFKIVNKHIHVNSGTRTPQSQAGAMYVKLTLGDALADYANQTAVQEIKGAYDSAKAGKKSREATISDMASVITNQVSRGTYISAHLRAGAVDIQNIYMTATEKQAFRSAVATVGNISLLEETKPRHFHLQIN